MTDVMILERSTLANDLRLPPQAKQILRYLEKGKSITPLEAQMIFQMIGSSLAGAIRDIRNAGHSVQTKMHRDQNGHKYAEYTLDQKLTFVNTGVRKGEISVIMAGVGIGRSTVRRVG